jgi:hypothetical protein
MRQDQPELTLDEKLENEKLGNELEATQYEPGISYPT